ncbi:spermidine synthase [Actinocorallia longicatena]|uniref:Spermidine synthase n=1 Tax=Actinocorallia longicatena TaxID=111803 RepID=A0ABP6QIM1_9ACTN
MALRFEELDWRPTPIGEISLRRRREPVLDVDVYEIKLDDEYLMSSLFTVAEIALADLGLGALTGDGFDVVVGGLGLGYTAKAALDHQSVRTLRVLDTLPEVIDWHRRGLLPLGPALTGDPRCELVHADFFAAVADGFDAPVDAILLDVDHSPRHVLHPGHAALYTPAGLAGLAACLNPGGVFALWSNDPPDEPFMATLGDVFPGPEAHVVSFPNHLQGRESTNTVYVAKR